MLRSRHDTKDEVFDSLSNDPRFLLRLIQTTDPTDDRFLPAATKILGMAGITEEQRAAAQQAYQLATGPPWVAPAAPQAAAAAAPPAQDSQEAVKKLSSY